MPAPGHQYNCTTIQNPFEEPPPRISEYTASEIATLQSRLDKQLGPEYISTRAGPGGNRVHYLAAEKVINLANEVFGFAGWSSQIKNVQIDYVDEAAGGKVSLGLSIIVRVTLRNGVFHEDIGYGQIDNARGKAAAFEKAKKEAATDALKRALRTFGNVLGNCLYDKDYLIKVTKIKAPPSKWDAENLHRHPDFAPTKKETSEENDTTTAANTSTNTSSTSAAGAPQGLPQKQQQQQPHQQQSKVSTSNGLSNNKDGLTKLELHSASTEIDDAVMAEFEDEFNRGYLFDDIDLEDGHPDAIILPPDNQTTAAPTTSKTQPTRTTSPFRHSSSSTTRPPSLPPPPTTAAFDQSRQPAASRPPPQHEPPVGFITSRAAELLATTANPPNPASLPKFNPRAESPSIRKTSGVDHAKSAPIKRESIVAGAVKASPTTPLRTPQQQQQQQGGTNRAPSSSYTPTMGTRNSSGPSAGTNGDSSGTVVAAGSTTPNANYGYFSNPSENPTRKIGMPPAAHANAGLRSGTPYKVPRPYTTNPAPSTTTTSNTSVPNPAVSDVRVDARQPLGDVSNARSNTTLALASIAHETGKESVPHAVSALHHENVIGGHVKRRRISDA